MSRSAVVIDVKSPREIAKIRRSCELTAEILSKLAALVRPGLSTEELDRFAAEMISGYPGARAAFLGYRGFPAHLCVSINAEVVHGLPRKSKVVRNGDLVSLDFGIEFEGYYGDSATTVAVGHISPSAAKLAQATQESLEAAILKVGPGVSTGDLGWAIQSLVEGRGFKVVRDFVGHGIGRHLHEEPAIPNWGEPGRGPRLIEGMTIAIEPMVTSGSGEVVIGADGWTAKTKDNELAAHYEHTVLVTSGGCEVLTRTQETAKTL